MYRLITSPLFTTLKMSHNERDNGIVAANKKSKESTGLKTRKFVSDSKRSQSIAAVHNRQTSFDLVDKDEIISFSKQTQLKVADHKEEAGVKD